MDKVSFYQLVHVYSFHAAAETKSQSILGKILQEKIEEGQIGDWKPDLPFTSKDDFTFGKQILCSSSVRFLVSNSLLDWMRALLNYMAPESPLQHHLLFLTSFILQVRNIINICRVASFYCLQASRQSFLLPFSLETSHWYFRSQFCSFCLQYYL